MFEETPAKLRRIVLILYAIGSPSFCLVSALLIGPDWFGPVSLLAGLCLLSGLWVLLRRNPGSWDWLVTASLVPVACCGISAWVLGERGMVFLAIASAPIAWSAVLFRLPALITALTASGALCFLLYWHDTDLAQALAATGFYLTIEILLAWICYGKTAQRRQARLESLARHINDIELIVSDTGVILSANDRAFSAYGYAEIELIGMNLRQLRAAGEQGLLPGQLNAALEQEQIIFDTIHVRRNGSQFPVEVSSRHFEFEGKTCIHSLVRDISQRKRIEEELRHSRIQLQLAISGAGLGLWEWNIPTGSLSFDEEWARIGGYGKAELEPLTMDAWRQMVNPEDLELIDQLTREHFAGRSGEFVTEARMRHKDGTWIWVLFRGKVAEWTPEGRPLRMVGTQEDITQRKEEEGRNSSMFKELLAQNDLKERLFTILAHDLRGPIGNLNSLLGMAVEGKLGIVELQESLPHLKYASEAAYNLLENILQWVRSSMDEIMVLQERIVVDQLLTTVQGWQEPAARAKSILLLVENAPQLSVMADQRIAETILRNLVSNAVKFSPGGSRIIITAASFPQLQEIHLSVIDQGIGVPPEVQQRINHREPAKRSQGTAGEGGSGLGLLFCQEMAERMHARILVESTPGQGSRFSLAIPDLLDGELAPD